MEEIAIHIAKHLHTYRVNVLEKTNGIEAKNADKNSDDIIGTIKALFHAKRRCNVLLVDDLYRTGNTLTECVNVLREDPNIDKIYVLAMTKTRSKQDWV